MTNRRMAATQTLSIVLFVSLPPWTFDERFDWPFLDVPVHSVATTETPVVNLGLSKDSAVVVVVVVLLGQQ
jgi:hypothetical protein